MISNEERNVFISSMSEYDFCLKTVRVRDLFNSCKEFFDEYFRGAITIDGEILTDSYAQVSPTGFACFLKEILNAIFGNAEVEVKMTQEYGQFFARIIWNSRIKLEISTKKRLSQIAKFSGFEVNFSFGKEYNIATLNIKTKISDILKIYANSDSKILPALISVFFLS